MKIIALGAILGNLEPIKLIREEIVQSDLVLLTGNITNYGGWNEAKTTIEILKMLNPNILAVMGSVDTKAVLDFLEYEDISIHGIGRIIENVGIYGVGGGNRTLFNRPTELNERDINKLLHDGYQSVKDCEFIILVSHIPSLNSKLDETARGDHVGSKTIRSFIFKNQPKVLLSSSAYGGAKLDRFGMSYIASPGPLKMGGYVIIDTNSETNSVEVKKTCI